MNIPNVKNTLCIPSALTKSLRPARDICLVYGNRAIAEGLLNSDLLSLKTVYGV